MIESLMSIQLLEGSKSKDDLVQIQDIYKELKNRRDEYTFWLDKNNHAGSEKKRQVAEYFQ